MYRRSPIGTASEGTGFQRIWLLWVSLAFIIHSIVLLSGQVGYWLRHGDWIELPSLYLFVSFEAPRQMGNVWLIPSWLVGSWPWLESPSSWYGLHKILYGTLKSISVPGMSFLLAVIFFFIGISGDQPAAGARSQAHSGDEDRRDGT